MLVNGLAISFIAAGTNSSIIVYLSLVCSVSHRYKYQVPMIGKVISVDLVRY